MNGEGHDPRKFELVHTSPVREVTRKEIVPGKYGIVQVEGDTPPGTVFIGIREAAHASQLRAAAATLIQLADAMEAA